MGERGTFMELVEIEVEPFMRFNFAGTSLNHTEAL
jgi:hypothetical protein